MDRNEDATGDEDNGTQEWKKDSIKNGEDCSNAYAPVEGEKNDVRRGGQAGRSANNHRTRSTVHAAEDFLFPILSAAKLSGRRRVDRGSSRECPSSFSHTATVLPALSLGFGLNLPASKGGQCVLCRSLSSLAVLHPIPTAHPDAEDMSRPESSSAASAPSAREFHPADHSQPVDAAAVISSAARSACGRDAVPTDGISGAWDPGTVPYRIFWPVC
ncbi:hypothetical protein VTN00DRAFT_2540 [Thermoascus crustaceus]|uniref:uncharacterized protein n=1 Tax=Thermoascus crustaceus TaxID=5088 RepID=UPI003744829F